MKPFVYTFPNGHNAQAIRVYQLAELSSALRELGIHYPRPTIVLVGGASGVSGDELTHLHQFFVKVLAPLAESSGAAIIDGGTDAGVMRLMGQTRAEIKAIFPLIGVAATGTIALSPDVLARPHNELLEPHHSHFMLVPGSQWGDESPWIAHVAHVLAGQKPSMTVLVNGGEIAWDDIAESVEATRPVIVIEGSGRTADTLASAMRGEQVSGRAQKLIASGLLHRIDPADGIESLTRTLKNYL
ncbi:MAG: hypothetical protein NVSMB27_44710 [Ktedonobacteraceae bacterium]